MKTILIVDDDSKFSKALQIRLEHAGYQVLNALNGIDGLHLAEERKPDLAILDFWLPMGSGPAIAYRMRESCPDLPFIFLTGDDRSGVRETAIKLGAFSFFEKPYNLPNLLQAIEDATSPAPQLPFSVVPLETAPAKRSKPNRVFIIEDDEKISKALALRMKAAGYEVGVAQDAVTGVANAVKFNPHLVLLDISIPGGNGFSVAERIQTLVPSLAHIIFLTASKRGDFRQRAKELGAAGYFEKPYDSRLLLATIHDVLEGNIITSETDEI